jgi:murein DD-endopeptidase MepM/ murein hydrolase activator NlpD
MRRRIKISVFLILGIVLVPNFFVLGQNSDAINSEIKELNSEISDYKNNLKKLEDRQKEYSRQIETKQKEKATLGNQLSILDNRIAKAELDIEMVQNDIERNKLEMQKTDVEIETKNSEIDYEKNQLADVVRLMQKRDNVGSLEVILLNDSLADFLAQVKALEDINEGIEDSMEDLKKLKRQLEKEREQLGLQQNDLKELEAEMIEKQKRLENEVQTKSLVLSQVNQSEKEYQRLLEQAKREQQEAEAEITQLEKIVRQKLAQMEGDQLALNDDGIIWPVTKNVVTTYFHDPEYPFRYIFEHPAVDIRAAQGTVLKAAASGYVARVKFDGSSAYGYIMIIHGDGLSTVYGHISKAYVQEDEFVIQGQRIGLTGGLPGTPGAGKLTTGPHLHFEVRLNGIPVDPLAYLP